uniref:Uncharacterized protein n=1 Tax=Rhizophagus irregularis (strain DAOM 181602 / DAOM 197198 / MUCL 43194) TaxID=747089 RepID=U9UKJ2_RHIID
MSTMTLILFLGGSQASSLRYHLLLTALQFPRARDFSTEPFLSSLIGSSLLILTEKAFAALTK